MTTGDQQRKHHRAHELTQIHARVLDALCLALPALSRGDAEAALTAAAVSRAQQIRGIDRHLTEFPDALTSRNGVAPAAFDRLLHVLAHAGHPVTVPACTGCGRTDVALRHRTPQGRQCQSCSWKARERHCAHCGELRPVARRSERGPQCRACYRADSDLRRRCARCGRELAPHPT
ncbi:hypothetical protein [Nocardia sp. NPDC049707]|uniref:hypothetical protein n=1 Tax=Nocardia sp. NPDC049707 TaxID=3154735 RepID=UPI003444D273